MRSRHGVPFDIAAESQKVTIERLLAYRDLPTCRHRSGKGWIAVATGQPSNDLNGVVSLSTGPIASRDIAAAVEWLDGLPACWLTQAPDPGLTHGLEAVGARSERTGRWCGRAVSDADVAHASVEWCGEPEAWLEPALRCGWYDLEHVDGLVQHVREAMTDRRFGHWIVRSGSEPVAMASGFVGSAVEVVAVAVVESHRRLGLGAALVSTVLAWGAGHGAAHGVAAPSPEGGRLFAHLGFRSARVTPDVCFYLPA